MASAIHVMPDLRATGPERIHCRLDARDLRHPLVHSRGRMGDILLDLFITHAEPVALNSARYSSKRRCSERPVPSKLLRSLPGGTSLPSRLKQTIPLCKLM